MIVDKTLIPLELAHLPYVHGKTYEEYWESAGFRELAARVARHVGRVVALFIDALRVDYVFLGEGTPGASTIFLRTAAVGDKRERVQGRLPSLEG
jgi:polyphosphate glucokinase